MSLNSLLTRASRLPRSTARGSPHARPRPPIVEKAKPTRPRTTSVITPLTILLRIRAGEPAHRTPLPVMIGEPLAGLARWLGEEPGAKNFIPRVRLLIL